VWISLHLNFETQQHELSELVFNLQEGADAAMDPDEEENDAGLTLHDLKLLFHGDGDKMLSKVLRICTANKCWCSRLDIIVRAVLILSDNCHLKILSRRYLDYAGFIKRKFVWMNCKEILFLLWHSVFNSALPVVCLPCLCLSQIHVDSWEDVMDVIDINGDGFISLEELDRCAPYPVQMMQTCPEAFNSM
jgi:hypothetical protein